MGDRVTIRPEKNSPLSGIRGDYLVARDDDGNWRALQLWSNTGDTVLSPFAGIGSEGYSSLCMNRKFIGIELKPSYFKIACRNLEKALEESRQETLF